MKTTYSSILSLSLTLPLLLAACSETLPPRSPIVDKTFPPATQAQVASPTEPPTAVTEALIPAFNPNLIADTAPASPSTFSVSVHEVDAREFFMSLVVDSQENMVVHPDVTGRISLELKNVNIPQVLNAVQKVYGYDYSKTDIGYIVYPATLQTKIFKIDHIDLLRQGSSSTRVTSGQLNNGSRRNNNYAQGSQNNQNYDPNNSSNSNAQTSGSWINTSSKTDFWEELQQSLATVVEVSSAIPNSDELSNPQTGGKVVINRQTGIVVVRANPTQMREVEKLIDSTQNQIGRQVVIEAKILEIVLDDQHQDGVNWANVMHNAKFGLLSSVTPLPAAASVASKVFTIGGSWGDFYAFLELMESQGKTNILSSPRISTLNNQKAVIKIGQDEYFITDVSSTNNILNGGGANNTVSQDITWTPFFSGIALDVTPQISDNNDITLHIHPSITRVTEQIKDFTINDQAGKIPLALNSVRESDSIVNAQDGQIIVIGGLMQEKREENQQGVSLLSRIPYFGHAFREDKGTGQKSELVILLKPTIIASGSDWNQPMQDSRQRMEQLEKKQLWK